MPASTSDDHLDFVQRWSAWSTMGRTATVFELLTQDTDILASYSGDCELRFSDQRIIEATFEAAQRIDGQVVLLLVSPHLRLIGGPEAHSVIGQTRQGQRIEVRGSLVPLDTTSTALGVEQLFRPNVIDIKNGSRASFSQVEYTLTNLEFMPFGLALSDPLPSTIGTFQKHEDYERFIAEMRHLGSSRPTANVTLAARPGESLNTYSPEQLDSAMDTVCEAASLLRGTRIEWIRVLYRSRVRDVIRTRHEARVTKSYSSLAPVPLEPFAGLVPGELPRDPLGPALAMIIPGYSELRNLLRLDILVDSLMDAKSADDFLEARAVKLCVTLEMLLNSFVVSSISGIRDRYLRSSAIKRLQRELRPVVDDFIEREGGSADTAAKIKDKLGNLNRPSFAEKLDSLCSYANLEVSRDDLKRAKRIRDSLIHTGSFPQSSALDDGSTPMTKIQQYMLLVDFLDRLLLKLVGYSGVYRSRRSPSPIDWKVIEI